MKITGKITMCEVREGISKTTGAQWKSADYVIVYDGHYANGSSCQRSLNFNVFGRERLNDLKILKGQSGTLDIETVTRTATSSNGNQYIQNVFEVLGWTPDGTSAPAPTATPVQAAPQAQVLQPAPQTTPSNEDNSDLPF